jgi:hypothetical protein
VKSIPAVLSLNDSVAEWLMRNMWLRAHEMGTQVKVGWKFTSRILEGKRSPRVLSEPWWGDGLFGWQAPKGSPKKVAPPFGDGAASSRRVGS